MGIEVLRPHARQSRCRKPLHPVLGSFRYADNGRSHRVWFPMIIVRYRSRTRGTPKNPNNFSSSFHLQTAARSCGRSGFRGHPEQILELLVHYSNNTADLRTQGNAQRKWKLVSLSVDGIDAFHWSSWISATYQVKGYNHPITVVLDSTEHETVGEVEILLSENHSPDDIDQARRAVNEVFSRFGAWVLSAVPNFIVSNHALRG